MVSTCLRLSVMAKPTLSSFDVCALTGATYRQLDVWTRKGYVVPAQPATGSGSQRRWSGDELDRVRQLVTRSAELRSGLGAVDR